jgi:hypothetical protein
MGVDKDSKLCYNYCCSDNTAFINNCIFILRTHRHETHFYRQSNILYKGWDLIGRGDSTQSNICPQGDGWATMELVSPEKNRIVKAKCSTVSGNTGCLEDADFKTKPFASEDGVCAPLNRVPYPLPKIAK